MGLSKSLTREEAAALGFGESLKNAHLPRREVTCPAAFAVGGETAPCALCRVDGSLVEARMSPGTYYGRCTAEYTGCPTWQAEKNAEASLRKLQKSRGR